MKINITVEDKINGNVRIAFDPPASMIMKKGKWEELTPAEGYALFIAAKCTELSKKANSAWKLN